MLKNIFASIVMLSRTIGFSQTYTFPEESGQHEGTWLQWPHHYQHGITYRNRIEQTWVDMTKALHINEKVHIIAYNETEKKRIINLLERAKVSLKNVDFKIYPTDDVWVRDNGPIFVKDQSGHLLIEDWGFNGWGGKYKYTNCNQIPSKIAKDLGVKAIDLNNDMINEGGSIELDGGGVLVACKSSVISQSPANTVRNPGITEIQATNNFKKYYGVSKVIWLDGNTGLDVTDMHIDGFMKFVDHNTMLVMEEEDLLEMGVSEKDIKTLYSAQNADGQEYKKVYIPATKIKVKTAYGKQLNEYGSYVNYYVANGVVLVPNYTDTNDKIANQIIQKQYPTRTVIGIDVRNMYENGGMIHCVTQQQPAGKLLKNDTDI